MKRILAPLALAALLAAAQAADYDTSIAEARDAIQKSQFTQALDAARRARAQNAKDFRSYYYEAMARLGLGQRDEARQAVQAAQERAPASARASLDKLAQMTADAGQEAPKEAARESPSAAGPVFVSCTLVETQKDDKTKQREYTAIFRLERGNFQGWSEKRSEWVANSCVLANVWPKAANYVDVVHKCEMTDQRFAYTTSHRENETQVLFTWSINRMTGKYYGEYKYDSGNYHAGYDELGTCRAVKDPSADQKQKF